MFAPVAEFLGLHPNQAVSEIYQQGYGDMFFGMTMETLFGDFHGPKRLNPVNDYLKYKAAKETPTGRNYLRALRDAECRLWTLSGKIWRIELTDLFC